MAIAIALPAMAATESANFPANFADRRRCDFVSLLKAIETSSNLRMIGTDAIIRSANRGVL